MHIPDGYLDLPLALTFYILSFAVLAYSIIRGRKELDESKIPLIGVVAAGIFVAQMLDWPIPGGTSAHFVGGGLAAVLLGPYIGSIVMASVVIVQCLIFGDGGITALGANLWNMAVINVYAAYFIYSILKKKLLVKNIEISSFASGWLGITLAAIFAGIELGISSTFRYSILVTVSVMGVWHFLLGIIEGIITSAVVMYSYVYLQAQKRYIV